MEGHSWTWRLQSEKKIRSLGIPFNPQLPLLSDVTKLRSEKECVSRAFALFAFMHLVFDEILPDELESILNRHSLYQALSTVEKSMLHQPERRAELDMRIEALYALSWSLSHLGKIDCGDYVPDTLASHFPDVENPDALNLLRLNSKLRGLHEIAEELDFIYCHHWALVHCRIHQLPNPGSIPESVVRERRQALEWIISDEAWDDIELDT